LRPRYTPAVRERRLWLRLFRPRLQVRQRHRRSPRRTRGRRQNAPRNPLPLRLPLRHHEEGLITNTALWAVFVVQYLPSIARGVASRINLTRVGSLPHEYFLLRPTARVPPVPPRSRAATPPDSASDRSPATALSLRLSPLRPRAFADRVFVHHRTAS